jgi:hypothetical protein
VAKVPVVVEQAFEPLPPVVTVPHENFAGSLEATVKVGETPGVVSVTVNELPLV